MQRSTACRIIQQARCDHSPLFQELSYAMPEWVFARQDPAAVKRDPQETELFKSENSGENEYAGTDALVREILQNALDAGQQDQPVRVRFALHQAADSPPDDVLADYMQRLEVPLRHRDIEYTAAGLPDLTNQFLVVEDFGTRGLCGDPMRNKDPETGHSEREDFYWFWRNIGRSGKTGDDLGRWGLGKAVYRAASRTGCMLGLTVRSSDQQSMLMGQAVLKIHSLDDVEYVSDGFWCDGVDPQNKVPVPIQQPETLEQFRQHWKLTRTTEPGLSVVVPYAAEELTGLRLLQAVCINFFVPILQGQLIVDLVAADLSMQEARLDQGSLLTWIEKIPWNGPKRAKRHAPPPLPFFARCLQDSVPPTVTKLLGEKAIPKWSEEAFAAADLKSLQNRLADGHLVHVQVQVNLLQKRDEPVVGLMSVFLQKEPQETPGDTYFVREGMTITKLTSKAAIRGVQAFVHVDRGHLARFLGDSEGPAHESWDSSAERPQKFWKTWKGRVQFCAKVVNPLLDLLMPPNQQADFDLLSDLFSIERIKLPERGTKEKEKSQEPRNFPPIPRVQRWFRVDPKSGGFRVTAASKQEIPAGALLRVLAAYDTPRGNPLSKWTELDFDFRREDSSLEFSSDGVKVTRVSGNELLLSHLDPGFWLAVNGFDANLDVFVRVDDEVADVDDGESTPSGAPVPALVAVPASDGNAAAGEMVAEEPQPVARPRRKKRGGIIGILNKLRGASTDDVDDAGATAEGAEI